MSGIQMILTALGAGVAFINYTVFLLISRRNSLPFAPIVLCCIILPLLFCIFFGKFAESNFPRVYETLKWIYIAIGLIYSVSFTAFSIYVMSPPDVTEEADVFIVFGCKTYGYTPSYALQRRLDTAYDLLVKNPEATAVLSGGMGDDETVSEAESMRAYLTSRGIDEKRLIIEDRSKSTSENIEFSMKLIRDAGLSGTRISAVSNDFHIRRIKKLALQKGHDILLSPSKMEFGARLLQNLTREYMVWIREGVENAIKRK